MTCRHAPGDRSCTTQYPQPYQAPEPTPKTPDSKIRSMQNILTKLENDPTLAIVYYKGKPVSKLNVS